jgi:hypothetical protein
MMNIFEIINANIVALSEDLNIMHRKIDEMHQVLYPLQEQPNTTGDVPANSQISGGTDII